MLYNDLLIEDHNGDKRTVKRCQQKTQSEFWKEIFALYPDIEVLGNYSERHKISPRGLWPWSKWHRRDFIKAKKRIMSFTIV